MCMAEKSAMICLSEPFSQEPQRTLAQGKSYRSAAASGAVAEGQELDFGALFRHIGSEHSILESRKIKCSIVCRHTSSRIVFSVVFVHIVLRYVSRHVKIPLGCFYPVWRPCRALKTSWSEGNNGLMRGLETMGDWPDPRPVDVPLRKKMI